MPSNPRDPKMSEEAQVELILLRPDPVEEGPGDAGLIVGGAAVAAFAGMARGAGKSAFARVHRGHELEAGGQPSGRPDPRDGDRVLL